MASKDEAANQTGMRSRGLVRVIALVSVMAIVTSFVLYSAARVEWKIDRIDGTGGPVYWPYVATDDSGTLHMTYYMDGALIHSSLTDDGWEHSTVVEAPIWGTSPIVFESDGTPHVCYQVEESTYSISNFILMHAVTADGVWSPSVVSNTSVQGSHSIALDASGNAHIAFIRPGEFVCANDMSGDWQETLLLNNTGSVPHYGMTSIVVDASGHTHVAVGYNRGFVGAFSEVGDGWNLTTLFCWDLTYDSVSTAIGEDGAVLVGYWGYPAGEPEKQGVMLAAKGSGGWTFESVYTVETGPNEFRCSISTVGGGIVKIAMDRYDNRGRSLAVITSCEGGWEYSEVVDSYNHPAYSMFQSQLSICSTEEGTTSVSVSSGGAEYATDSLDLSDRLSAVSLIALAGYSIGLVVWIIVWRVARVVSNRTRKNSGDR